MADNARIMEDINIEKLRKLVRSYLERHHYEAAVFWGDKVVTFSNGDPIDVYWLVQAYIHTSQYHRACLLINTYNLTLNGSLCYLAALCLFKVLEYQDSLSLLESAAWPSVCTPAPSSNGAMKDTESCSSTQQKQQQKKDGGFTRPIPDLDDMISLECSRQMLRAKIYEATDNSVQATECYVAALQADPLCYDALKSLTGHYMLTMKEEKDLHDSLPLEICCKNQSQIDLVRVCYETKVNKCAIDQPNLSKQMNDKSDGSTKPIRTKVDLDALPLTVAPLSNNLDIITARAEKLYYKCSFVSCFQLTRRVLEQDPYHTECLPIHIACLIELKQSNALFLLAHKLVDLYPETALSWFAVGSYYYLIGKNEHARRYLSKATTIDKVFGPAWIAFAHSFASENEHDQASAAYFKAAQLMKGSHLPLLYIGMEYTLTNNPKFAEKFFQKAVMMAPDDPFVLHELGVVNFNNEQYDAARKYLSRAVLVVQRLYGEGNNYYSIPSQWTPLLNNLGHTLRKMGQYKEALHYHYEALRLLPSEASTYTAIGFCLGLQGELEEAIEALHNSLSLHRDQTVAATLLSTFMDQLAVTEQPFPEDEDAPIPEYSNLSERIGGLRKEGIIINSAGSSSSVLCSIATNTEQQQQLAISLDHAMHDTSDIDVAPVTTASASESADTSADLLESSSVLSATSPPPNKSLLSIEDMVMDEESD
uniref:Cell division cycle protein 16 homolog n=2 Tax=Hirondellea gigas TaxID=1518452 RepID=A0A2P2I516_9CRUS